MTVGVLLVAVVAWAADPVVWKLTWSDPNPVGSVSSYRVERLTQLADGVSRELLAVVRYPTREWVIRLPPGKSTVAVYATGTNAVDSDPVTADINMLLQLTELKVTAEGRVQ